MGNILTTILSNKIAAVAAPLLGGSLIGFSMANDVKTWYPTIKKPTWNPPNAIFGPVWSVLYLVMGYASYKVATVTSSPVPLFLYTAQLALNFAYSPLFFKKHDLKMASVDVTALLGMLVATMVSFYGVDHNAAYMLIPYLGWTSFATALTWDIYLRNKDDGSEEAAGLLERVQGVISEGTATAANLFLKPAGEAQSDTLPISEETVPNAGEAESASKKK